MTFHIVWKNFEIFKYLFMKSSILFSILYEQEKNFFFNFRDTFKPQTNLDIWGLAKVFNGSPLLLHCSTRAYLFLPDEGSYFDQIRLLFISCIWWCFLSKMIINVTPERQFVVPLCNFTSPHSVILQRIDKKSHRKLCRFTKISIFILSPH